MLTSSDLQSVLRDVAQTATRVQKHLSANGDLSAPLLAAAYVAAEKLGQQLDKLGAKLGADNGRD
jgi:hypothetical protein